MVEDRLSALRHGDLVEVRPAAEILATLDARGVLDGLPFMPEMLAFCGQRFRVDRRADKICDTMVTARSREIPGAVLLEDLRCDGSGHGGCQAECRLFWKEAWLRRVDGPAAATGGDDGALRELVERNAQHTVEGETRYMCQATEHFRASVRLRSWDPRPYWRELRNGNIPLPRWLGVVARAIVQEPRRRLGMRGPFPVLGPRDSDALLQHLNLQPGEVVRTRTVEEIQPTLTREGVNNGVWFDDENIPFCGRTFRVRRRINHLIDEHNGKMLDLEKEWLSLEGVKCSGEHSIGRWFCPRAFYVQWTEDWLDRVPK
jgi:hypothetical protein